MGPPAFFKINLFEKYDILQVNQRIPERHKNTEVNERVLKNIGTC